MKFVIAVVMLALALGSQSAVVPLSYVSSPLSYTAVSGPGLYAAAPGAITAYAAPGAITYAAHATPGAITYAAHAPITAYAAPAPITYAAPAIIPAPAVVAAEGSYVAQTRGAVHVAPLPGHINSAASVNLEPAPGTI